MPRADNSTETITASFVEGTIFYFKSKESLSYVLAESGINTSVGQWVLRWDDYPEYFEIAYEGNLTPEDPFHIEGNGFKTPIATITQWCKKLSDALRKSNIPHEIVHGDYDENEFAVFSFGIKRQKGTWTTP